MKLIKLIDSSSMQKLADGCVLPDGQVAIAWCGEWKTHGTYPSIAAFTAIQSRVPNRTIENYKPNHNEYCLGVHTYSFQLVRDEDVTGVSGTGVVAVGCDFFEAGCVLQWVGEIKSTFWYPDRKTIEALHSHSGKTRIVVDR